MLSDNDIHHIVGLLYVSAGEVGNVTMLGEKVFNAASGTKRDVDIVIVKAGAVAVIAAEVKHTSRPLDVAVVEGLCQKFSDMPTITERNIVSSASFTGPAIAKARTHGVTCMTLRRGPVGRLGSIDLSMLTEIEFSAPLWDDGPHIRLFTEPDLPRELKDRLRPALRVRYPKNHSPSVPFAVFQDRLVAAALEQQSLPADSSPGSVAVRLKITDAPYFTVARTRYTVVKVEITGTAARKRGTAPLKDMLTMEDENGVAFANAVVGEVGDLLVALATAKDGNSLNGMVLPPGIRRVRPIRAKLPQAGA